MQRLANALAQLRATSQVSVNGRLAKPLDPDEELSEFDQRLARMRTARSMADAGTPPKVDIDALIARWRADRPRLDGFTKREVRALCWDARAASDPEFVKAVGGIPALATSARLLRGLWYVHERQWRLPTSDLIERLIASRNPKGGGSSRWLRDVRQWPGVLTATAPEAIARKTEEDWRTAWSNLERLGITPDGSLGTVAIDQMVKRWVAEALSFRTSSRGAEAFAAGHEGLLSHPRIGASHFLYAVEALVGGVDRASKAFRERIASWILSDARLGHPARVRTRGNWIGISARTRQLAIQLFAARDLGAFFEVLIGANFDDQRREPFWQRYVTSPQLVNFSIASDWADRRRLVARLGKEQADVAHLNGGPSELSAFVMHFSGRQEIVIAEMSKANNAMYLYDAGVFERGVGSIQESSKFHYHALKNTSLMLNRYSHTTGWHYTFENILRRYGIFPGSR